MLAVADKQTRAHGIEREHFKKVEKELNEL